MHKIKIQISISHKISILLLPKFPNPRPLSKCVISQLYFIHSKIYSYARQYSMYDIFWFYVKWENLNWIFQVSKMLSIHRDRGKSIWNNSTMYKCKSSDAVVSAAFQSWFSASLNGNLCNKIMTKTIVFWLDVIKIS